MSTPPRETRLLELLSGGVGMARGMTFVPPEALAGLYWGVTDPHPCVAAAADLELDFVFVWESDPEATEIVDSLRAVGTAAFLVIPGPFSFTARERGWNEALRLTISAPGSRAEWLDSAARYCAEAALSASEKGALAVVVAEDFADQVGLFLGADWLVSSLVPRLSGIAASLAERGIPAVLHTDGFAAAALASVNEAGYRAVHIGGLGWERFVQQYEAARAVGLAVIGGLEGEELRGGPLRAVRVGTQAALIAEATGLLVADDGGLTTAEEVGALVSALQAAVSGDGA